MPHSRYGVKCKGMAFQSRPLYVFDLPLNPNILQTRREWIIFAGLAIERINRLIDKNNG